MSAKASPRLRVGVDIGGTFTDIVFLDREGRLDRRKLPSTPADYAHAIIDGVTRYCAEIGASPTEVAEVVHATTVATNAILERKGAKTGLITTEGFRDVLELRRIRVPLSYDLGWKKPTPLVEREHRREVHERLDAKGGVLVPLDTASLEAAIDALAEAEVEAVAVAFLHAYRDPAHERLAGDRLRARLPHVHISLSSDILPEILEFERTSTTVVDAYVAPLVSRYLERLRAALAERKVKAPIWVMQSNGGLISAGSAATRPVTIIESGPAAGVVAGLRLARDCGLPNVITLDMGGTTTKASIIERGEILRASEYEVGSALSVSSRLVRGGGYVLRMPVIDISEVGAGGGSIAEIDAGGSLRVGPASAGAVPGPACYGQGNERPTVTDANLVLGYISRDSLAGGALQIDPALAERAIARHIAEPARLKLSEAAFGVHAVANSNMVRAIKSVSVERGRDPADFVMMAFGGAGPVHAAGVAHVLGIRQVLIPPAPGVFSAFGLLGAEVEHHTARTVLTPTLDASMTELERALDAMRVDVLARVREEGLEASRAEIHTFADLRYRGQSSELTVPLSPGPITPEALREAEQRFESEFERTYGHVGATKLFDLVTLRLVLRIPREVGRGTSWVAEPGAGIAAHQRDVYFGPEIGHLRVGVVNRPALDASPRNGPLLVQEYDTTIVVPPDARVRRDAHDNVLIDLAP